MGPESLVKMKFNGFYLQRLQTFFYSSHVLLPCVISTFFNYKNLLQGAATVHARSPAMQVSVHIVEFTRRTQSVFRWTVPQHLSENAVAAPRHSTSPLPPVLTCGVLRRPARRSSVQNAADSFRHSAVCRGICVYTAQVRFTSLWQRWKGAWFENDGHKQSLNSCVIMNLTELGLLSLSIPCGRH